MTDRVWEVTPQVAANRFGDVDQRVAGLAVTVADCDEGHDARWRFEGNLVGVDEDGRNAFGAALGFGRQIGLGRNASITPLVRIGYETFEGGEDQVAVSVAATLETSLPLGGSTSDRAPRFELVVRPEIATRHAATAWDQTLSFTDARFSSFVAAGFDIPLGDSFRGRIVAAHRYVAADLPVNSIGSVVLSLRKLATEGECLAYCWNVELWYSRGNGGYEGVLIGVSRRFGHD